MKDDKLSQTTLNQTVTEPSPSSNNEDVQRHWHGVVKRRSFLKSIGIAGACAETFRNGRCSTALLPICSEELRKHVLAYRNVRSGRNRGERRTTAG